MLGHLLPARDRGQLLKVKSYGQGPGGRPGSRLCCAVCPARPGVQQELRAQHRPEARSTASTARGRFRECTLHSHLIRTPGVISLIDDILTDHFLSQEYKKATDVHTYEARDSAQCRALLAS